MNPCTVLLADDHLIVRAGLRILLSMEPDITIVGEASTGREAVEMTGRLKPDVVVMDIAMPILNGLEATRQILHSAPATRVVILSAHADDAYIERVMAMGAAGYLIKQSSCDALAKAIRDAARGKTAFSPAIARRLNHHNQKAGADDERPPKADAAHLSPREMEVLQLIAEGNANKQTACLLGISIKTVEKHRQKIMQKLNIHDTASLTRYAISTGIVESLVHPTTLDGLI
jgi:DNA-binding NarL/FixJ family response regulator